MRYDVSAPVANKPAVLAWHGDDSFGHRAMYVWWAGGCRIWRRWNVNGTQDWNTEVAWANGLNVHGVSGWRLPSIADTASAGCDFSLAGGTDCGYNVDTASSEMAHMFYVTLGNKAYCAPGDATCAGGPQAGFGLSNTADFTNMQSYYYWSGTGYAPSPGYAWYFYTLVGYQGDLGKLSGLYAVAVRPGDVAAGVPEPATLGLTLTALGALALVRRRRPA